MYQGRSLSVRFDVKYRIPTVNNHDNHDDKTLWRPCLVLLFLALPALEPLNLATRLLELALHLAQVGCERDDGLGRWIKRR